MGLLGNVLTQGGIPRGAGIIRNLTKAFSKSPPCPGVGGGVGVFVDSYIMCITEEKTNNKVKTLYTAGTFGHN